MYGRTVMLKPYVRVNICREDWDNSVNTFTTNTRYVLQSRRSGEDIVIANDLPQFLLKRKSLLSNTWSCFFLKLCLRNSIKLENRPTSQILANESYRD
ncbi:hypothetical protein AVEN_146517-1 [Araneus ventricosus]|uniref:Uncharacterized protein n=1 Tax=Araneus ventricosus TaxID=182803 RepID=A0A4Y2MF91_ARAVE|nr:hypothetical protein AVEN_146517-1 [Araneus ventricosus]